MSAALNLEAGRAALAAQPFSVLLGTVLTALDENGAQLDLAISEQLLQGRGFVHGGVLSYLADNALTYAAATALGATVLTSEFKINFLRPAIGERLIVRAKLIHAGKSQAVSRCEIYAYRDGEERLCACAQGTISRAAEVPQ